MIFAVLVDGLPRLSMVASGKFGFLNYWLPPCNRDSGNVPDGYSWDLHREKIRWYSGKKKDSEN
jgi:hypothetical protein